MNGSSPNAPYSRGRELAAQWLGVLLGPLAWGLHLSLVYFLASVRCGPGLAAWLYGVTAAALAVVALGAYLAWRYRRPGNDAPGADDRAVARSRFFAAMGLLSALLFGVGIIVVTAPVALESTC